MQQTLHFYYYKKRLLSLVFLLFFTCVNSFAQADSVTWDFGTSSTPTALATSSTNANVSVANCSADTGKLCCTLATSSYTPPYITSQFSSSGYTGASGQPTIRANTVSGSFNVNTSTYISFTVTPNSGYSVTIKKIEFAALGVFFGPNAYTIRTSADGFSSSVGTGSLSTSYGSTKKSHTGLNIAGSPNTAIEVRIYAHGAVFTTTSGDFFIDDMVIGYDVASAGCSGTPTAGSATADTTTYCISGAPELTISGASSGSGISHQWFSSTDGISFSSVSGATTTTFTSSTLTDTTYFYCVTTCGNSSMSDTSDTVTIYVASPITNTVTISSSDTTICSGSAVTFTAALPGSTSPLVSLSGSVLTSTQSMNNTSSCVGSGGKYANGWNVSGHYWQYQISTLGYEDIIFNTPTSSSGTGPHNGSVEYSTDGTNFTNVTTYTWSGTGCTSTGNISLPNAANNQSALYVRLYMTGASSSSGTNRVNPDAFKGRAMAQNIYPSYQWKKNGTNVGIDSNIYIDNALANGDEVYVELTPGICASPATVLSDTITMNVNPLVTPTITITSTDTTICSGTGVTFTATATNEGTSPVYQWKLNGTNVGTNSSTYSSSTLSNNDMVSCVLTSSAACVTQSAATSDTITMIVNPLLTPTVSITSSDTTICNGTSVTFTASATNDGSSPTYQWKLNGANVGSNSTTYSNSALSNSDIVSCVLTSTATCVTQATVNSDTITMVVNPLLTPTVSISSTDTTICNGASVTFTASPSNGGSSPAYQWKLNGSNVGTNSATYTNSTLSNNDVVLCELTSNATCLTKNKDTSSSITMIVNPLLTPSVTVSATNTTICNGTSVTFTATLTNGGVTPAYQWKLNGSNVGSNSSTYSNGTLSNSDVVICELTSNATCLTKAKDTSNSITMTVNPLLTPAVSIVSTDTTICSGTSVTFTASQTNGGTSPAYQWMVNGSNVGTNSNTYSSSTLSNSDVVTCELTSSAACLVKAKDTSSSITMIVNSLLTPAVSIVSTDTTICNGTSVTFTASQTNGGTAPAYQWTMNGSAVGTNSSTFSSSTLNNNDVIKCELTSNATCLAKTKDTSSGISMIVNPLLNPSITINVTPGNTICLGEAVTFNTSTTFGGVSPSYQWLRNGVNVAGANNSTWTTTGLNQGDIVSCELISDAVCATPANDTSNDIAMTVTTGTSPTVSVSVVPGTNVPNGTSVTFSTVVGTAGTNPTYQWRKNGVDITGETNSTYTTTTLQANDKITVLVTSNAPCANPDTVTSKVIVMKVSVNGITGEHSNMNIFPNPNNGTFTLKGRFASSNKEGSVSIEVINSIGASVYRKSERLSDGELNAKIELGDNVVSGMYLVRLKAVDNIETLRFIVK